MGRTHHGWMNGRDMYTCILLGGNGRDDQTKTEDITHTNIFNKVLLRGEVVDRQQMVAVGGAMVGRAALQLQGSGAVGACSEG